MPKLPTTKLKLVPWIPPGTSIRKDKNSIKPKPTTKYKRDDPISPKTSPKKTADVPKEETPEEKDNENDVSLSSHSSCEAQDQLDIHLISINREIKLLQVHFESLRTSHISAHRLIDPQEMGDGSIKDLFDEAESCVKELNRQFDAIEYLVTVLQNTLDENQKIQEYSKVIEAKQKLLSMLLDMYEKVIIIFQFVFEKQDFKEMARLQDHLSRNLKLTEKKSVSQEAIIKDLERRLSIYQSKSSAMESYKTNLESAKAELERQLHYKESQIKYLNKELLNASGKQVKSDHEELIEIIEGIKSKAHSEKSALKKALKFQKGEFEKQVEKYEKLLQELSGKEKMMFDVAMQRDQLKVQLTVVNNNIIQQKNQIEEIKNQNLKLQNEISEREISHKKTITDLQNTIEDKSSELEKSLKTKAKLEKTIEELEEELKSKEYYRNVIRERENQTSVNLHKSKHADDMYEEVQCLISLLQSTREVFENLKRSSQIVSTAGDHVINDPEFESVQAEILAVVKETKEHLLQLKNMHKTLLQRQKEFPGQNDHANDMEEQLKRMEQLYNAAMKENVELKQEIDELKNSSIPSPTVQKNENYFAVGIPNDSIAKKLQLELLKKNDEVRKVKFDFKLRERDLEDQLKEYKGKLRSLEVDSMKISSLEDELRTTKLELSIFQKKREEETERFLQRIKDLQDSLDFKSGECESKKHYIQTLKSSYYRVFDDS